jgi:hypothetical protein
VAKLLTISAVEEGEGFSFTRNCVVPVIVTVKVEEMKKNWQERESSCIVSLTMLCRMVHEKNSEAYDALSYGSRRKS